MAADNVFVVVAVAASAGGIPALKELLASLPASFPAAVLIVQHLAPGHRSMLPGILARFTCLPTVEAREGAAVRRGLIVIAPPGHHMIVKRDGTISLTETAPIHHVRPSADALFESVAEAFGARAIGVVLSGTGEDGAHGAVVIKRHGGTVFAQRESDTLFFSGMPEAAIRAGVVDAVLQAAEIGPAIVEFATQHQTL